MREIEASNRLYEENGALYMTATIVTKLDTDLPESTQVTFILAGTHARHQSLHRSAAVPALHLVCARRIRPRAASAALLLVGLLEVDHQPHRRRARARGRGSRSDFRRSVRAARTRRAGATRDFREVLGRVGQSGELVSKARESLVSLGRTARVRAADRRTRR